MYKRQVAIVIPAFNEEASIFDVVYSVKEYGTAIVVDDASTDKTKQLAEDAGATVISHNKNKGYDGALNSGFIEADRRDFDVIITFDADGQHNSKMLKEYIDNLKEGVDLVLGVRPKPARFSEWIFMFYTRIRFGWKDPLCGMKGYSMKLYRSQGYFDSYNSIGTELAFTGLMNGFSYVQLPIVIIRRIDTPRFDTTIRSNWKIFKSLLKMIFLR
jgi:glycosyltransferase involved in cell wall biosynthesis